MTREERQRYWSPRALRRWVWTVALLEGLVLLALALVSTQATVGIKPNLVLAFCFHGLTHVGLWGSAWIGADLLSHQRPDNPDPARNPPPREVFAGLIGRLTPFYTGYLLWLITFAAACGAGIVDGGWLDAQLSPGPSTPSPGDWPAQWMGWPVVVWSGTCAYGSIAALLSGFFRRPRRFMVSLTALVPGTMLLGGIVVLLLFLGEFGASLAGTMVKTAIILIGWCMVNPLFIGLLWGNELLMALKSAQQSMSPAEMTLTGQLHVVHFYLIVAAFCVLSVLGIASSRYRQTRDISTT